LNKPDEIKNNIEIAREKLNNLANHYGLLDYRVMEQSILLDNLINQYNVLKYDRVYELTLY
jgi:hypothetical protein